MEKLLFFYFMLVTKLKATATVANAYYIKVWNYHFFRTVFLWIRGRVVKALSLESKGIKFDPSKDFIGENC